MKDKEPMLPDLRIAEVNAAVARRNGIGSHQSAKMQNDEWLTPPHILDALDIFDLDPCAPVNFPWRLARNTFNKNNDGLNQKWFCRLPLFSTVQK